MNFPFDRSTDNRYYSPPMMDAMPQYIDPVRLANRSERLSGQMSLDDMARLSSLLASTQGQVDIALELSVDHSKIRNIRGQIHANIKLVCQRCLQTMDYVVDSKVMLGIIRKREQADQLPTIYEPLLVETDEVSLLDIIEDEIILAMPNTPLHDLTKEKEVCENAAKHFGINSNNNSNNKDGEGEDKQENPFAVLAQIKLKNKKVKNKK